MINAIYSLSLIHLDVIFMHHLCFKLHRECELCFALCFPF